MIKYEVKPVVCDYGVFENDELKLILDIGSNAEAIVNILNADLENKKYETICEESVCTTKLLNDIWDRKINIELTLHELEDLIISLRVANKFITGNVGSELEEKLNNIVQLEKLKH